MIIKYSDAKIKIWDTRPLFNQEDEMNDDIPKLLSTLVNHQGMSKIITVQLKIELKYIYI